MKCLQGVRMLLVPAAAAAAALLLLLPLRLEPFSISPACPPHLPLADSLRCGSHPSAAASATSALPAADAPTASSATAAAATRAPSSSAASAKLTRAPAAPEAAAAVAAAGAAAAAGDPPAAPRRPAHDLPGVWVCIGERHECARVPIPRRRVSALACAAHCLLPDRQTGHTCWVPPTRLPAWSTRPAASPPCTIGLHLGGTLGCARCFFLHFFTSHPSLLLHSIGASATLAYEVYFPPDFDWMLGGKLPGLRQGDECSGGRYAVRGWCGSGGLWGSCLAGGGRRTAGGCTRWHARCFRPPTSSALLPIDSPIGSPNQIDLLRALRAGHLLQLPAQLAGVGGGTGLLLRPHTAAGPRVLAAAQHRPAGCAAAHGAPVRPSEALPVRCMATSALPVLPWPPSTYLRWLPNADHKGA